MHCLAHTPSSTVRLTACSMRWMPFCGTSRVMQATSGLSGSTLMPRPICVYRRYKYLYIHLFQVNV
jgi:hypothetical protein